MNSLLDIQVGGHTPTNTPAAFSLVGSSVTMLKRTGLVGAIIIAVLLIPLLAAPLMKSISDTDLISSRGAPFLTKSGFPTDVGTTWVYSTSLDVDYRVQIQSVFAKDGRIGLNVWRRMPSPEHSIDSSGVSYFTDEGFRILNTGIGLGSKMKRNQTYAVDHYIRVPLRRGERWKSTLNDFRTVKKNKNIESSGYMALEGSNEYYYYADKIETIETPIGTFDCIRVLRDIKKPTSDEYRDAFWYTDGIGLVKYVSRPPGADFTFQLKSMEIEKAADPQFSTSP